MKLGLFLRLAWSNIKKNHQLYIPHILAGTGLTAIFYIMLTLGKDDRLRNIKGGYAVPEIMMIGIWVVIILSVILVFFTNSFLMKQRTREYGMYNVLGMEKSHVGHIMFLENLISTVIAITAGVLSGMLVYKLCCMFICKILRVSTILGFYVNPECVWKTVAGFAAMYFAAFLWNRIRLARLKPVELLASAGAGEREPKTKWILLVIGLATLGTGYYLALKAESPLEVIKDFFIAVILVIVGTYALFLAGSVAFLKLLRRKKSFYYRKSNMIAVSDLLYRMKQNAVGLASIAILATGVLVMMSTTVSLYAGCEDSLKSMYMDGAADLFVEGGYSYRNDEEEKIYRFQLPEEELRAITERIAEKYGTKVKSFKPGRNLTESMTVEMNGATKTYVQERSFEIPPENAVDFLFMPIDDYNQITGRNVQFGDGEIAWVPLSDNAKDLNERVSGTIQFGDKTYTIGKKLDYFPQKGTEGSLLNVYAILMPSIEDVEGVGRQISRDLDWDMLRVSYMYAVQFEDTEKFAENDADHQSFADFCDAVRAYAKKEYDGDPSTHTRWDASWHMRDEMYGIYGSLFFLGILLSIVFLFATALIIYYKQISEGYDDRGRFQILLKVGMTEKETKATIRRQIVIVFFLPVITAVIHMTVAYPVTKKLLALLMLSNNKLFLLCTALTIVAFTLLYLLIYRLTARTYYRIVR
ncbi:MAG: ABC transporter permease [Lachnospiraceae bacterium]|nr:ABC transporter permease [Lachnospiraceae bacterium]